jgi:HEAT repeat protein
LASAATTRDKIGVCSVIQAARLRSAAPGLVAYLQDPDSSVRLEAVGTLANLDAKTAAPEIRKRLKDEESLVRQLAMHALGELGSKEAVPEIVLLLKDSEETTRDVAADTLVLLGAKEVVPVLLERLKGGTDSAKLAFCLGWLRSKEAMPGVRALLKEEDVDVRLAAVWALGRMGSDEGFPLAVEQLDHSVPRVRSAALRIVSEFEVKGAVPGLTRMLENQTLRVAAARGLCRLGSNEGVGPILEGWGKGAEQADDGFWLNALRGRETWDRLLKKDWTDSLEGTGREILERLAQEAGLPLEWSPKAKADEPHRIEPAWKRGRWTLLDALADAGSPYGLVLEKDRIRVLEKEEALAFWRDWAKK